MVLVAKGIRLINFRKTVPVVVVGMKKQNFESWEWDMSGKTKLTWSGIPTKRNATVVYPKNIYEGPAQNFTVRGIYLEHPKERY